MKIFKVKFAPQDVEEFFYNLFEEIVEYREKNNIIRHDFLNLLIKLKNEGFIPPDKDENVNAEVEEVKIKKLTMKEIAAQSFVFFLASYETASAPLAFCIYELAKNPKIQQKVHDEIDKTFNGVDMTYDSVKSLKYLECCILETLRKYAVVPLLSRRCTADYKIPNTDLIIPKGTELQIPSMFVQRDEDYFEQPLEFRPERFIDSANGQSKGKGITYMTFGDGPRHCIGMRMAKLNLSVGLTSLLAKFKFELVDERLYKNEVEFDRKQFPLTPKGRLMVRAVVR
jgi:cytochrome P450 family 6